VRSLKQNIPVPDIAELRDELGRIVQMLAALANAAREGETASFTPKKFRARHKLSESQYHKLRRQGRGPRTMSVGSCGERISRQAERDWIEARETEAEAAKETDIIAALAKQRGAPAQPKRQSTQTAPIENASTPSSEGESDTEKTRPASRSRAKTIKRMGCA
jgi:hypothetical protein